MSERPRADRSAAFVGWLAAFAIGALGLAVAAAAVSASGAFDEETPPATTVPVGTNLPRPPIRPARPPSLAKKPPDEGAVDAMRAHAAEAMGEVSADAMREVSAEPVRQPATERSKRRARRARSMR